MRDRKEIGGDGRRRARWLIRQLRIENVEEIDVDAIAADQGLVVRTGGIEGAKGRLASNGKTGIIRVAERVTDEKERRFVIAHELGHHGLHARHGSVSLCMDVDGDFVNYAESGQETEANCFAAELLMPMPIFDSRCDVARPSLDIIRSLAREFRTTMTATAIRFADGCPRSLRSRLGRGWPDSVVCARPRVLPVDSRRRPLARPFPRTRCILRHAPSPRPGARPCAGLAGPGGGRCVRKHHVLAAVQWHAHPALVALRTRCMTRPRCWASCPLRAPTRPRPGRRCRYGPVVYIVLAAARGLGHDHGTSGRVGRDRVGINLNPPYARRVDGAFASVAYW